MFNLLKSEKIMVISKVVTIVQKLQKTKIVYFNIYCMESDRLIELIMLYKAVLVDPPNQNDNN